MNPRVYIILFLFSVCNVLALDFEAYRTYGIVPFNASFSTSESGTYEWDFNGDTIIDSTSSTPFYIYNTSGMYDVSLTVNGTITTILNNYIRVNEYDKLYAINFIVYTTNGAVVAENVIDTQQNQVTAVVGTDVTLQFINPDNLTISLYVDGVVQNSPSENYTFQNISSDHTLSVGFLNESDNLYNITGAHTPNGQTIPHPNVSISEGLDFSLLVLPDREYTFDSEFYIDDIKRVDDHYYLGTGTRILIENVTSNHNFSVDFNYYEVEGYKTLDDLKFWNNYSYYPGNTINPNNIEYLGAFRLPSGSGYASWNYNNGGLTFYPAGDSVNNDSYPGSLFGVGHIYETMITEITIPEPIISDDLSELNYAEVIQAFGKKNTTRQIKAIAYLSGVEETHSDKLFWSWGGYFPLDDELNLAWTTINTTDPHVDGYWRLKDVNAGNIGYILFEIPKIWADQYADSRILATSRDRWGQSTDGHGPSVFAIAPWEEGNPPVNGTELNFTPLIRYSNDDYIQGYTITDYFGGAVWVTDDNDDSAVIFSSEMNYGVTWYGSGDTLSDIAHGPKSHYQKNVLRLFDPEDLKKVALGERPPYYPQPYANIDITDYMFGDNLLKGVAYDSENGFIYVLEYKADADKPVVHVFDVHGTSTHDADQNLDGVIDTSEIEQYVLQWKSDSVSLSTLIEALGLWKG